MEKAPASFSRLCCELLACVASVPVPRERNSGRTKELPSFPTPTSLFPPFALAQFFARPEFRSRRSGTLATQASELHSYQPISD